MLVSICHMILTRERSNPSDYQLFKAPNSKENIKLIEESAIEFLRKSGFDVSKLE